MRGFCSNCGHQLTDGARFCLSCGAAVTNERHTPQRQILFEGSVHKCPNCGEILDSFIAYCPACGYEIRNALSSNAVHEFALILGQSTNENQVIALIKNYPIPNTKEDVFEFMILASTNIFNESVVRVNRAWRIKFEQSYQKAKLLFTENDLLKIQELYDSTSKQIKKQNFTHGAKATSIAMVKTGGVFPKVARFILENLLLVLGIAAFLKAIQLNRIGENGVGFELLGGILLITSSLLLLKKNTSYLNIAIVTGAGCLTFYLAKFLDNGAGLQLISAVTLFIAFICFIKKSVQRSSGKGA